MHTIGYSYLTIYICPSHVPVLPKVLCLDEVYLGRKSVKKYVSVLLNFETNQVVDVLYGRSKNDLHSYFQRFSREQLDHVNYVSSDMFEGFRFLQMTYFKKAKVCIDSFHVFRLILDMFNTYLIKTMNQCERDSVDYYLLKNYRSLLLANQSTIDWTRIIKNRRLNQTVRTLRIKNLLFDIDPQIKHLYNLKEEYIFFNRSRNLNELEDRFNRLLSLFLNSPVKDAKRVGRTLSKWKNEILNSFVWFDGRRVSNGPIESRNNIIKLLIRNAAGYRNFDHLRTRIIYCINSKQKE